MCNFIEIQYPQNINFLQLKFFFGVSSQKLGFTSSIDHARQEMKQLIGKFSSVQCHSVVLDLLHELTQKNFKQILTYCWQRQFQIPAH